MGTHIAELVKNLERITEIKFRRQELLSLPDSPRKRELLHKLDESDEKIRNRSIVLVIALREAGLLSNYQIGALRRRIENAVYEV